MCLYTHLQDLCLSEWWKSNLLVHYNVFICKIKSISLEISARWSSFISNNAMCDEPKRLKSVDLLLIISIYKNATGIYGMSTQILYRKTVYCEQTLWGGNEATERNVVFQLKIECWVRLCGHRASTHIYRPVRSIAICERISDFHSLAVFFFSFTWVYLKIFAHSKR